MHRKYTPRVLIGFWTSAAFAGLISAIWMVNTDVFRWFMDSFENYYLNRFWNYFPKLSFYILSKLFLIRTDNKHPNYQPLFLAQISCIWFWLIWNYSYLWNLIMIFEKFFLFFGICVSQSFPTPSKKYLL